MGQYWSTKITVICEFILRSVATSRYETPGLIWEITRNEMCGLHIRREQREVCHTIASAEQFHPVYASIYVYRGEGGGVDLIKHGFLMERASRLAARHRGEFARCTSLPKILNGV
jgi:hypothetical protein